MRSDECRWSNGKGTWPDTEGSGFESQSALNFSYSKFASREKLFIDSYKANENRIRKMVIVHLMCMCISLIRRYAHAHPIILSMQCTCANVKVIDQTNKLLGKS